MNTNFPPSTSSYPLFSFIRLGKSATLNGTTYRVVGRVRSETTVVREWDWEDRVYAKEPNYVVDEWILQDGHGRQVYLSEYADKEWDFVVSQAVERTDKQVPTNRPSMAVFGGLSKEGVLEKGESKVLFIEGENPDGEIVGEEFFFTDFRENGKLYSCEWENKNDGTMEGIWFFENHEWTREQIMSAFGEVELAQKTRQQTSQKLEFTIWAGVFKFLFWAAVLASLIFSTLPIGSKIHSSVQSQADSENGILFGPIQLDDKGHVYRFVIRSSYVVDGTSEVLFRLLDEQYAILAEKEDEHWRESGRDADGSWTEGHYETSYLIRLQQPDSYYAQLIAKPPLPPQGYLNLVVYKNPLLGRYFVASTAIIGLAYGFFLLKKRMV